MHFLEAVILFYLLHAVYTHHLSVKLRTRKSGISKVDSKENPPIHYFFVNSCHCLKKVTLPFY